MKGYIMALLQRLNKPIFPIITPLNRVLPDRIFYFGRDDAPTFRYKRKTPIDVVGFSFHQNRWFWKRYGRFKDDVIKGTKFKDFI